MSRLGPLERFPSAVRGTTAFVVVADTGAMLVVRPLGEFSGFAAPAHPKSALRHVRTTCALAEEFCCSSPGAAAQGNSSYLLVCRRSTALAR